MENQDEYGLEDQEEEYDNEVDDNVSVPSRQLMPAAIEDRYERNSSPTRH